MVQELDTSVVPTIKHESMCLKHLIHPITSHFCAGGSMSGVESAVSCILSLGIYSPSFSSISRRDVSYLAVAVQQLVVVSQWFSSIQRWSV